MTILLKGRVGSHAYGLAHEGSDEDFLGIYAAPTEKLFTLSKPKETIVTKGPDCTIHEAEKYCHLALSCNPTALELLWLPDYIDHHPLGELLVAWRHMFLARDKIRAAYLGYATAQIKRMGDMSYPPDLARHNSLRAKMRKPETTVEEILAKRTKNARHAARLLWQAWSLDMYGEIQVELDRGVADDVKGIGQAAATGDLQRLDDLMYTVECRFNRDAKHSAVRADQDRYMVDRWLTEVRLEMLTATHAQPRFLSSAKPPVPAPAQQQ